MRFLHIFKKHLHLILLIAVILFGGLLRFYNSNWDNFLIFHPDERNIDAAVARVSFFSHMDPGFFAYGGLPIYLYRYTGDILNILLNSTAWTTDWGHINLIGRSFSALFSLLTIIAIYFLGRKIFDRKVGLIAAFIFAFSVSSIQIAHFATTESFLIFIVTLISLVAVFLFEIPKFKLSILLGILFGLGIAAKTTAASFILIPLLSFALIFLRLKKNKKEIINFSLKFLLFTISGGITFLLLSLYTILSYKKFLESMSYESGVVSGRLPVPYTHQFDKAIPYLFESYNLFWQMGPIFVFSLIGLVLIFLIYLKKENSLYLFLLLFPIIYFLYVGSWHTKFIRYMSILLPFLSIYAAFFIYVFIKKFKKLGIITSILFLITTFLWALSYMAVYMNPQTRYKASEWMYQNIKLKDKVYTEHWDDGLPIHIDGISKTIPTEQLTIYDNEFNGKAEYYADKLSKGNYIILATRRLYGTLRYLPKQFPITSKYYNRLLNGDLGYIKVAEFSSYPSIFGIKINDDSSEESFQVYDHPKILIFKNVKEYSRKKLWKLLKTE